jgi:hypothetical protein
VTEIPLRFSSFHRADRLIGLQPIRMGHRIIGSDRDIVIGDRGQVLPARNTKNPLAQTTTVGVAPELSQPPAAAAAAAVRALLAWVIRSPCLRHCGHGASIGGGAE